MKPNKVNEKQPVRPKHFAGPFGYGSGTVDGAKFLFIHADYTFDEIARILGTSPQDQANAERIVACLNALEGLNPEALPDILEKLTTYLATSNHKYAPGHACEECELTEAFAKLVLK